MDPLTRGALRNRMVRVGSAVHLRSFLDPPEPKGHTIKGSGHVSFKANRFNTTTMPIDHALRRACSRHMQGLGVQSSDYDFGQVAVLDKNAIVSINGRRFNHVLMRVENILHHLSNMNQLRHITPRWRTNYMCDYYEASRRNTGIYPVRLFVSLPQTSNEILPPQESCE